MVIIGALHSLLNPISERILSRFAAWARTAGEQGPGARAIEVPAGKGALRTGLGSRPSLVMRGLSAVGDAARVVARR